MRRFSPAVLAAAILAGCASLPAAAATRSDTPVNASFGRTWDAAVEYFARSTMRVKALERASGFIAAETGRITGDKSKFAACNIAGVVNIAPDSATFNALIRGDSTHATVRLAASWLGSDGKGDPLECVSRDAWEREVEAAIKQSAEGR